MNKDQFKGGVKEICGKVQEGFGKLVGNPFQQDMGVELQVDGRSQVHLGDIKELEELEIFDRKFDRRRDAWVNAKG
jgi:uncharacterized protein YjbJ (UPF0337 family)